MGDNVNIEIGKIYDLKYGIYWGCVEVIPSTNKIKVVARHLALDPDDECVTIRSIETTGIHGDREITISVYDFRIAVGEAA